MIRYLKRITPSLNIKINNSFPMKSLLFISMTLSLSLVQSSDILPNCMDFNSSSSVTTLIQNNTVGNKTNLEIQLDSNASCIFYTYTWETKLNFNPPLTAKFGRYAYQYPTWQCIALSFEDVPDD